MKVQCIPVPEKGCWKLKSLEKGTKGRILGYKRVVTLVSAAFLVDTDKRDKFIRSKVPQVHHWIEGYLVLDSEDLIDQSVRVLYRPYEHPYWATDALQLPVTHCETAFLVGDFVYAHRIVRD